MGTAESPDITVQLEAWNRGDAGALDQLVALVYDDIRSIARRQLHRQPRGQVVGSGTLVHEAYMKLVQAGRLRCNNRVHFFALCSQIIRRILVDHARKQCSAKRGGLSKVSLDEALLGTKARGLDIQALDEAISALAKIDPRKSRIVEFRFFVGLSVAETAEILEISEETVTRDWRMAKTWLFRVLTQRESSI